MKHVIHTNRWSFYQCNRFNRFTDLIVTLSWVIGNLYFFSATVFAIAGLPSYFLVYFTFKSTNREKRNQAMCSTAPVIAFICLKK